MTSPVLQPTMVGLGRMGGNMAARLARHGFIVHGFDPSDDSRAALANEAGVRLHANLHDAVLAQDTAGDKTAAKPRVVWLMLPAGDITSNTLHALQDIIEPGDIIVDGGNANYLDSQQRATHWAARDVQFVDCGVSGGVWGLENGYCLMAGGSNAAVAHLGPLLRALAANSHAEPDQGWLHCGASGAGHFTKMIHNGIEYGMMQAFAEGFALMDGRPDLNLNVAEIAELWRHGSVVRSWLLDLTANALSDPNAIADVAPVVADSGEGRWTIDEAIRQGIPAPVIAASMMSRFASQGKADTANKLLSLMRNGFGGHTTTNKQ